jgi:hypothetical protein
MKSSRLLIVSAVLFLLGFGSLGVGWNGTASVNVAFPVSGCSVHFCGSASGGWALGGLLGLTLGILFLIVALIGMILARTGK